MKKKAKWIALLLVMTLLAGTMPTAAYDSDERYDPAEEDVIGDEGTIGTDEADVPVEESGSVNEDGNPEEDLILDETETMNGEEESEEEEETKIPSVVYDSHVQTFGWSKPVKDGALSGTTGLAKRLEAVHISIECEDEELTGGIEYRTHVQTYGWQNWVSDGALSGTTGKSKRLEAIRIRLTGELAEQYDVYYRVHAQTYGWLGWAKNGMAAGTAGYSKRLEAYQIVLVKKGDEPPTSAVEAYKSANPHKFTVLSSIGGGCVEDLTEYVECDDCGLVTERVTEAPGHKYTREYLVRPTEEAPGTVQYTCSVCGDSYEEEVEYNDIQLTYEAYVQGQGWCGETPEGEIIGTFGQALRMEALKVTLEDGQDSTVKVKVHMQTYGWKAAVGSGEVAGLPGSGKRMEAMQIKLEGPAADMYDIYYRTHVQTYGWLGWAKNGENSGTADLSKRIEALEIHLVEKGDPAPGSTSRRFIDWREYGSKTLSSWFGIDRAKLVSYLQSHEHDNYYLGTKFPTKSIEAIYGQDYFSPNGDPNASGLARNPGTYMNCVGFVWHVLYKCGVSYTKIPRLADSGPYHAWRGGARCTWPALWSANNLKRYAFSNRDLMLQSGILEKGDIIWCTSPSDNHILIFWGDNPYEDLAWHSLTSGNKICCIHGANKFSGTWNVLKWHELNL